MGWVPVNENVHEQLPFFTIEWPWKERPELDYLTVEIDGLRGRINHFDILQTNGAPKTLRAPGEQASPKNNP